ncbi:MAG: endonuclease/exonuclease/phosphatase family protein [Micropruina sp.]
MTKASRSPTPAVIPPTPAVIPPTPAVIPPTPAVIPPTSCRHPGLAPGSRDKPLGPVCGCVRDCPAEPQAWAGAEDASFNVNGIRAAERRGFGRWLAATAPDVVGLQEVRCTPAQVPSEVMAGYHLTYHPGELAGRSRVALMTRVPPSSVRLGFGHRSDLEGRYIEADLEIGGVGLTVGSVYVPKGATWAGPDADPAKYRRKMRFLASFRAYLTRAGAPPARGRPGVPGDG